MLPFGFFAMCFIVVAVLRVGFFVGPEYRMPWFCVGFVVLGAGCPLVVGGDLVFVFIVRFLLLSVRAPLALCDDKLVRRYCPWEYCAVGMAGCNMVGACRCACVLVNVA